MDEPAPPTIAYMREVAERFISGEDRKLQTAKHLAHYVLALTEEANEADPLSLPGS